MRSVPEGVEDRRRIRLHTRRLGLNFALVIWTCVMIWLGHWWPVTVVGTICLVTTVASAYHMGKADAYHERIAMLPGFDDVEAAGHDGTMRTEVGTGPGGDFTWDDLNKHE